LPDPVKVCLSDLLDPRKKKSENTILDDYLFSLIILQPKLCYSRQTMVMQI